MDNCLTKNAVISTPNGLVKIKKLWEKFSNKIIKDKENGEWFIPADKISVYAYDKTVNKVKETIIKKMYRTKIDKTVNQITFDDKTTICFTDSHVLLTDGGWKNKYKKNTLICSVTDIDDDECEKSKPVYKFIKKVDNVKYSGYVYDFDVEKYDSYIANDIICYCMK